MSTTSIATDPDRSRAAHAVYLDIATQREAVTELLEEWMAGDTDTPEITIVDARNLAAGIVASIDTLKTLGQPDKISPTES